MLKACVVRAQAVQRSAGASQAFRGASRMPTRSFFGGLFGKKEKREVSCWTAERRRQRQSLAVEASATPPSGFVCAAWSSLFFLLLLLPHTAPSGPVLASKSADACQTLQGKNDGVLQWARAAKPGCELAPATAPEGLEIATVAGVGWSLACCVMPRRYKCACACVHGSSSLRCVQ